VSEVSTIREARADDAPFPWLMLTYAASMSPPGRLIDAAGTKYPAIVLSVRDGSPAVRFSLVMRAELDAGSTPVPRRK
jgi:hypothetical protein